MKLESLSALEIGELVNSRQISAVEVVNYFLDRVYTHNSKVNAFVYTKIDEARKDAEWADIKVKQGTKLPFAGVPFALKDFLPSKKGWTNSHGGVKSLIATDTEDSQFCSAVTKLGGIAIGKTNAPAFGFSGACQNKLYGATHNPFDLSRSSGGSSGGSAAAVAAGFVPIAEGGDAGGSIRIPAGWCNLFGFKASVGTVPSICRPDAWTATHPYCCNGALTKTVADSATILNKMAQYCPRDPMSLPINANKDFTELMKKPVKGMRVALTLDFDMYPVDSDVQTAIINAAHKLEEAGVFVDYVGFNFKHSLDEILRCWAWAISVDTALDIKHWKAAGLDLIRDHADELPQEFIEYNEIATRVNVDDFRTFNEIRTDILDNFEDVFDKGYDAIISPTAICPAMPIQDNGKVYSVAGVRLNSKLNFIGFAETPLVNFVGYPAASVPAGFAKGCPVGMQIIGKQYRDEDVFALSHTFEQIQPWIQNFDNLDI